MTNNVKQLLQMFSLGLGVAWGWVVCIILRTTIAPPPLVG